MKPTLFFCACLMLFAIGSKAQVTQLNNNNSLRVTVPLSSTKTIVISEIDSSIWVTDLATSAGTVQISPDVKFEGSWALLSGQVIFRGSTAATGSEVYISDGTLAGTTLVKDIFAGATGSEPGNMVLLNGFVYFVAQTAAEGRELWKSDGTLGNTSIVKNINAGAADAFDTGLGNFNEIFSNGSYLLFAATTAASGKELWKSDGSTLGTVLLQEINPLAASSNPHSFTQYNGLALFLATDDTHGEELWKTDGTTTELLKDINPLGDSCNARLFFRYNSILLFVATTVANGEEIWKTDGTELGTEMVKDINTGPSSSTSVEILPGFGFPIFTGFHLFNNKVYFTATDGASNGELWGSDGTEANTILLNDIVPGIGGFPIILLQDAINLPTKFIFPVSDGVSRSELWESDGTIGNTKLFKSFDPPANEFPFILLSFGVDTSTGSLTYPLFQGDKFFFTASTAASGRELWISNGTDSLVANTHIVKEINPAAADGISSTAPSWLYTTTHLFFAADDGVNGNELWKTDGTVGGTEMVQDINLNAGNADPNFLLLLNGKVAFNAADGDEGDPSEEFDLYVVDGNFTPLPVNLTDFTVSLNAGDALLQWKTMQEINSKDFTVQRSYDGRNFESIGIVLAAGNAPNGHSYSFKDAGIINSGKDVAYYRLVASDKDGKTKNTNIIALKLARNSKWNVVVLSNPVQDNLKILLSGTTRKVQIFVRDVSGKTIYTSSLQNINGQISLPAKLQRGVHVLTVETNNERKVIQFIKQ